MQPQAEEPNQSTSQDVSERQLYQPKDQNQEGSQPSAFSGYDLTHPTSEAQAQSASDAAPPTETERLQWEASEYAHHQKGMLWLSGLVLLMAPFVAIAYFTRSWTFFAVTLALGIALGVIAFRSPRTIHYELSDEGLRIEDKFYDFNEFHSFGVVGNDDLYSVMFMPTKRFMPALHVYCEEKYGEKIVDMIGNRLPMQRIEQSWLDDVAQRLRF